MPNRQYEKGYRGELYTRDALRKIGFKAERSAASHGPWDVVGVRGDAVVLVQCKRGGRPTPCDWKTLTELQTPPGAIKLLLWMPDGLQQGRILYCADQSGDISLPAWCASLGWQYGPPPRQQALRLS